MKIWTTEHTFKHPWDTVVQAAWRKYPNPLNSNVLGIDVVDRQMGKDGVLRSHRLMQTSWGLADWVQKLIGVDRPGYVSEKSEVDARKKVMKLKSQNLTFSNFLNVDEQLVYSQHPTEPHSTLLKQEVAITVKGLPLTSYLENLVLNTCSGNAAKGRQAMEWVICKIKTEAEDLSRAAREGVEDLSRAANRGVEDLTRVAREGVENLDAFMNSKDSV